MLIGYLLLINAASFILMLNDKYKAIKNRWRIAEITFLVLALCGGSLGVIAGMYAFRHKTQHIKFSIGMPLIFATQIILGIVILSHYI